MATSIERQRSRFKEILKGHVRRDLRKYIVHGEMIGRRGKDLISIPVPQIDLPHFRFGKAGEGVGQGNGEEGDSLGSTGQPGDGGGGAGDQPGQHITEVELTIDELAEMLSQEFALPFLKPKGEKNVEEKKDRYISTRPTGPESLRITKRTLKRAFIRFWSSMDSDEAEAADFDIGRFLDVFYPVRSDKIYRSWKSYWEKRTKAVIIYMMDISGSMDEEQKSIVRTICFWMDIWLGSKYPGVEKRYIVHDATAGEVDRDTFYSTRESGGTMISSAYHLAGLMTSGENNYRSKFGPGYDPHSTNIYFFHFSDGDNFQEDSRHALDLLVKDLLPKCNLFGYGQVVSGYGSGEFLGILERIKNSYPHLALAKIDDPDGIYNALATFLRQEKKGVS